MGRTMCLHIVQTYISIGYVPVLSRSLNARASAVVTEELPMNTESSAYHCRRGHVPRLCEEHMCMGAGMVGVDGEDLRP